MIEINYNINVRSKIEKDANLKTSWQNRMKYLRDIYGITGLLFVICGKLLG